MNCDIHSTLYKRNAETIPFFMDGADRGKISFIHHPLAGDKLQLLYMNGANSRTEKISCN
jgi:hypothetical protein